MIEFLGAKKSFRRKTFTLLPKLEEEKRRDSLSNIVSVEPSYSTDANEWYGTWRGTLFSFFYGSDDKDITISVTAIEQHHFPRAFNFYIFDENGNTIFRGVSDYTYSFSFPLKYEGIQRNFWFRVEVPESELSSNVPEENLERVVNITVTENYIHVIKNQEFEYMNYYHWSFPFYFVEGKIRNFVIEGKVEENNYKKFNFYILDSSNFENFLTKASYLPCYERDNVVEDSFSIPISVNQAKEGIYFFVENIDSAKETITLSFNIKYEIRHIDSTISNVVAFLGIIIAFFGFITTIVALISWLLSRSTRS